MFYDYTDFIEKWETVFSLFFALPFKILLKLRHRRVTCNRYRLQLDFVLIFVMLRYLNAMVDKVIAWWLDTTVVRSAKEQRITFNFSADESKVNKDTCKYKKINVSREGRRELPKN